MEETTEFQNDTLPEGFSLTGTNSDEPEEEEADVVDPLFDDIDPLVPKKSAAIENEEEEDGFEEFVALTTEYDDDSSY